MKFLLVLVLLFLGFYSWNKYNKGYGTDWIGPMFWFGKISNLSKRKNPTKEQRSWLRYHAFIYTSSGIIVAILILTGIF